MIWSGNSDKPVPPICLLVSANIPAHILVRVMANTRNRFMQSVNSTLHDLHAFCHEMTLSSVSAYIGTHKRTNEENGLELQIASHWNEALREMVPQKHQLPDDIQNSVKKIQRCSNVMKKKKIKIKWCIYLVLLIFEIRKLCCRTLYIVKINQNLIIENKKPNNPTHGYLRKTFRFC